MAFRVAAASSDGENIDLHFAQAHTFYIYDLTLTGCTFIERRSAFENLGHSEKEFDRISLILKDCAAVLVSRIGPAAARLLLQRGLRVFETPYPLGAVLEKLRAQNFQPPANQAGI